MAAQSVFSTEARLLPSRLSQAAQTIWEISIGPENFKKSQFCCSWEPEQECTEDPIMGWVYQKLDLKAFWRDCW